MSEYQALISALEWHLDAGVDEALANEPQDKTIKAPPPQHSVHSPIPQSSNPPLGTAAAKLEAVSLAQKAKTLGELKTAIKDFDGLAIRKTATNMVFGGGNERANVMIVGEAPGADEDRQGGPFVGVSGQLMDLIFSCIGLSRDASKSEEAIYISNILNWRPPGNRTPSPSEIEVSLPFIERHIELVNPKILVFVGGVSGKSLLNRNESISRLRKKWHDYKGGIQALVTYHPAFLLHNPAQKKAVWMDMIMLMKKREDLGIV